MLSPRSLAAALGLPPPTDEQAAVIAAPARSALVVAGAGAGKTETMAARVVWLVATGQVLPEQVLGLTFTRKAAQQLGVRVRTRLRRLAGSRLLDDLDPTGARRAAVLAGRADRRHLPRLRRPPGRRARPAAARRARCPAARQHRCLAARPPGGHDLGGRPGRRPGARDRHRVRPRAGRRARRAPRRACRGAGARRGAGRAARPGAPRAAAEGRAVAALPAVAGRAAHAARPHPAGRGVRGPQAGGARARLRRPARDRRPGGRRAPRGRRAGAGDVPGRPARRVPGHRARPAGAAARAVRRRPRSAGRADARRSPPSATRASRSTAGAARARATSRGSARTSRVRTAPPPTSTACSRASATRRRCSRWRTPCPRRSGRLPVRSAWARWRPGRAPEQATSGSRCCRMSRRSSTGWPTRSPHAGRRRRTSARSHPRRPSSCAAGPTWTPSPPRSGRVTFRWRWWAWAVCSTPRRSATWSAPCAWSRIRSPGRRRYGCSPGRAGGWAWQTSRRSGRARGSWHRAPPLPRHRSRPPSSRSVRCPASTPSRRASSTRWTTRARPAATRRRASPGSAGSRRSCAGCGRGRRCR